MNQFCISIDISKVPIDNKQACFITGVFFFKTHIVLSKELFK